MLYLIIIENIYFLNVFYIINTIHSDYLPIIKFKLINMELNLNGSTLNIVTINRFQLKITIITY